MPDPFRYCFRFCCDPGFNDEKETQKLLTFVDDARIDDVMVFVNVEEINTGHFDEKEQAVYLDLLRRLQPLLRQKGVSLSVNHWHSVMHADLGKQFRPDQPFRAMVDKNGTASALCVCPLDTAWQNYMAGVYRRYAALSPDTVWVEDDFRLHNHDPLDWGGCFCEEHMRLYSEKAGKTLTREEFVAGVLQPGHVHPYRKIWLDACRETMEQAAKNIGDAVHDENPSVRVGLMSSVPYVHSAEGRDWKTLLTAFAGENDPVCRVHLPSYQEMAPWEYLFRFHMVSMVNRALLPKNTRVYPELENYPYSRFSKSRKFTRFQLLSSLALDLAGMTIDLFDLNGRGIIETDGYQQMLFAVKDYLNRQNASGVFSLPRSGVCVLVDEKASYRLHTKTGARMEELYPEEIFWAGILPAMGIPFYIGADPTESQGVAAVSGQYLRNLSEQQLRRLFEENFVLLNGDAMDTLCDLGLGELAGLSSVRWMRQNSGEYAYEQVTNGKVYTTVENARASAIISSADAARPTFCDDAIVTEYSSLFTSFRTRVCPFEVVVNDRVLLYPFGHFESPQDIPPMLRNDVRQELLQDILARCDKADFPMVVGSPYLTPYCMKHGNALYLYLVNGAFDEAPEIKLANLPDGRYCITADGSDGLQCKITISVQDGVCTLPVCIGSMESVMLTLTKI